MTEVERIAKLLDCSLDEAQNVIDADSRIDKGEKLFELDKDQKKAEKKMRSVGVKTVNPYGKQTTRERPQDRQKRFLIETLARALTDHTPPAEMEITNPEREIVFTYADRKFKIVLSAPRN